MSVSRKQWIWPGVLFGVGVLGAALNLPTVMAIGLVGSLAALAFVTFRQQRDMSAARPELTNDERVLMKPVFQAHDELRQVVESGGSLYRPLAKEALDEADAIVKHCIEQVKLRTTVRRSLERRYASEKDLKDLELRRDAATSEGERQSLDAAIAARGLELAEYDSIAEAPALVEANLRKAAAMLSELKARFAVARTDTAAADDSALSESFQRMQSLTESFEEVEQMLRGRSS